MALRGRTEGPAAPPSPLKLPHSSPPNGGRVSASCSAALVTLTGCSVLTRPSVSGECEPYNTLSAEEGGRVNMWSHTCNNTLSTFYIQLHTCEPQSGRLSFLFACTVSLFVAGCPPVCILLCGQKTAHSFTQKRHWSITAVSTTLDDSPCFYRQFIVTQSRLLTGRNDGKYRNYNKKQRHSYTQFPKLGDKMSAALP